MKLKLTQDDNTVHLALERTPLGKQALDTKQPSARERQLLLLLEKDSTIGAQAVSKLLEKVNLADLAEKGWVVYNVLAGELRLEPTKAQSAAEELSSQADQTSVSARTNSAVDLEAIKIVQALL